MTENKYISNEEKDKQLVYFRFPSSEPGLYEQFTMYLYMWAAYADYEIRVMEKDMIRAKMELSGLISPIAFEEQWQKVWHDFKSHNDYECEQYIEKTYKELNLNKEDRQKIFDDLKDILNVEGKEDGTEKMNLFKFKKMLAI